MTFVCSIVCCWKSNHLHIIWNKKELCAHLLQVSTDMHMYQAPYSSCTLFLAQLLLTTDQYRSDTDSVYWQDALSSLLYTHRHWWAGQRKRDHAFAFTHMLTVWLHRVPVFLLGCFPTCSSSSHPPNALGQLCWQNNKEKITDSSCPRGAVGLLNILSVIETANKRHDRNNNTGNGSRLESSSKGFLKDRTTHTVKYSCM